MEKYIDHQADGEELEYWQDIYDGCIYGYGCTRYTLQEAVRQFNKDIQMYHYNNSEYEKILK
jgi:hypothetical protein